MTPESMTWLLLLGVVCRLPFGVVAMQWENERIRFALDQVLRDR